MKSITKHITYIEATKSSTATRNGIENIPSEKQLERMRLAAEHLFEPARVHFNVKCSINSFFRCDALNKAVGSSSPNHPNGEAIDMDRDKYMSDLFQGSEVTNKMWFEFIYWNCEFRELIWEYGTKENPSWVHAAYRKGGNVKKCKVAIHGKGYKVFDPIAEGYISATKPSYCIIMKDIRI